MTESSTFIDETIEIKEELQRWFFILEPEYNSWKANKTHSLAFWNQKV